MKIILAALASCLMGVASGGCGGQNPDYSAQDMDPAIRKQVSTLAEADERLTGELENKTIKWLSDWDINQGATGKTTPTDLAVFQERYGGEVQWYQCIYEQRYDQLANYINADEGIDFFYAGNFDAFPKGAVKEMFVPYDEYIDLSSELWDDVREINDAIQWQGKHYMAVAQMTGDNCAVVYNRDTVQELGFEDPAELVARGEWTWDVFQEMLEAYCDVENQKFGLDGWWFETALSATTGVPYIGLEDGKLVSNLTNANIERVQNLMYDLYNRDCIAIGVGDFGWSDKPAYIGQGKELFYPVGLYTFYTKASATGENGEQTGWKATYGENCMFVPMPRDPKADAHYIPANLDSYLFVKGGGNPEGVAKYLECKRATLMNGELKKIGDQQFQDDYSWTQEMVEMKNAMDALAMEHPVIDFKNGVSDDLTVLIDDSVTGIRASAKGCMWNETLSALKDPVQTMLDEANGD